MERELLTTRIYHDHEISKACGPIIAYAASTEAH
jgi:hypothetical protein